MNKVILIVFSGLLAVQLVSAQSHTTWAAAQVPGLEGVPVSLLAVPGNSPGLRVMYNALKTDKRILDLLKAGILAPLSNSILFVPGGKTMLQTTKTTVVETMTSESAIQDKKSPDTENVKTNAPKENNVLIKPNTQNAGLNLDILGNKLKKMPEMPDMKLDIAVETSDLPIKKVKIPKRKKNISRRRSRKRVSKRGLGSKKLKPVISPFKAAIVQPSGQPVEKIGTMSSQRRPVYNQDIEGANTIVRSDIVQEVSVPKVVNVALDYDSKALTDTLLVMLKTMHMIQKYIKDSLTTTTTTTTTSTTTTPTTTTTTTTRPTTSTSPYYRILSTVPTTTPTTTTPSPTTEATSTEFYMTDMTTTDIETTTEDYRPVDSSADNKANSELAPDVVDFIQAFKKAIKLAKKKEEIPKKPKGADKLTQLHKLLEGISPSQLQTLVDLIKAKANEGKPKPLPKSESLPKPKPIFAPPPPPGSEHKGPPREFRQMQNSRSGPYRPNGDYGPPPDSRGPPPDWARGPGGRSRGPPGPPGPGGPRGPGGPGGPGMRGGPDLNNPQIARLIRVIKTGGHPKHNFLSGRTPGSSAAAAGGEAPEAGEGPTGLLGNPLMMSMLMNRGGQGGGGGIASLLGGAAGGANPLAALMPGGAGAAGGGGNPLSMLQGLGGLPGSGGAGASSEGGMNPAMLAAIMGGGQGGGGGGLGALGGGYGGMLAGLGL